MFSISFVCLPHQTWLKVIDSGHVACLYLNCTSFRKHIFWNKHPMCCGAQLAAQQYKHFLWWPRHPVSQQTKSDQCPSFWLMIRVHHLVCMSTQCAMCSAVMTCATLVNTHRQSAFYQLY